MFCGHHAQPSLLTTTRVQLALQRYQRVISQWPIDKLRPNTQLQDVIKKDVDRKYGPDATVVANEAAELKQSAALLSLLNDSYKKKVCGGALGNIRIWIADIAVCTSTPYERR